MDRVNELLQKGKMLLGQENVESFQLFTEAHNLAQDIHDKVGEAWSLYYLATLEQFDGMFKESMEHLQEAEELMRDEGLNFGIYQCELLLGHLYRNLNNDPLALVHYEKAKPLAESEEALKLSHWIAGCYTRLTEPDLAIKEANEMVKYMHHHHLKMDYLVDVTLSETYLSMRRYDEAVSLCEKALLNPSIDHISRIEANQVLGAAYQRQRKYDEALVMYNQALKLMNENDDYSYLIPIHRHIAEVYIEVDERDHAFKHLQFAMTESIKHQSKREEAQIYFMYAELYESMEQFDKAYDYYKKGSVLEKALVVHNEVAKHEFLVNEQMHDKL